MKIVLDVKNQGHVPSFKNKKRIMRNHLVTEPKTKRWMQGCIDSFESQLFIASRITGGETLTVPPPRSLIVSSLPLDDSRQWIPAIHIYCLPCKKGEEGATIIIEEITNV